MRYLSLALLSGVSLLHGATLTVTPNVIYDCSNGLGRAALTWSGATGPVQVHVNLPDGPAMTGWEQPSASASTGDWVTDDMEFFLVNQQGSVEAAAVAHVFCGGTSDTLNQGLANGSYFPLQTGNTWIYRHKSRQITSDYVTRKITGTQLVNGVTYFVLTTFAGDTESTTLIRGDQQGRIWALDPQSPAETLLLNPATLRPSAFLNALGAFEDSVAQTIPGYQQEDQLYVRGIGLARSYTTLVAGSSGGFLSSLELVEVRLAGGIRLSVPAPHVAVAMESATLDVTGKHVTNCVVPCYFTACGLVPGTDPEGTYKPCAQARVEAGAALDYSIQVELQDANGNAVYQATPAPGSGDLVRYVQVQLYSQLNQPVAPGDYKLVTKLVSNGATLASASVAVRID